MAHGSKNCQQDLDNWNLLLTNLKYMSGANDHTNTANSHCTSEEDQQAKKNIDKKLHLPCDFEDSSGSKTLLIKDRKIHTTQSLALFIAFPKDSQGSHAQPPPPWVQICSTRFRTMKLCLACAGPGDVVGSSLFPQSFTQHVRYIKWMNPHLWKLYGYSQELVKSQVKAGPHSSGHKQIYAIPLQNVTWFTKIHILDDHTCFCSKQTPLMLIHSFKWFYTGQWT